MRIKLFIEAFENEEWSTVSRSFFEYLIEYEGRSKLNKFAMLESLPIDSELLTFRMHGFSMKPEFSAFTKYFIKWASLQNRVFGVAQNGFVLLSNNVSVSVPLEHEIQTPDWLK